MKKIIFISLLVVLVVFLSYLVGPFFGALYLYFFPSVGAGLFIGLIGYTIALIGFVNSYIFFLTSGVSSFIKEKKYLLLSIMIAPALIFVLYFDIKHLYFSCIVGLIGWGLGLGVEKGMKMMKK
ncbi:MAG: hypothetical protein WC725_02835 [Patescibacteria group bacterium]|jgi:hypothetical protein